MVTVVTTKQQLKEVIQDVFSEFLLGGQLEKKSEENTPDWITRNEACKILGVSLPTLDRYMKEGALKKYTLGEGLGPRSKRIRLKRHEVESFFDEK